MTNEKTIQLMRSKLYAYRSGYLKAIARKDLIAAEKFKDGYASTKERIAELKEE